MFDIIGRHQILYSLVTMILVSNLLVLQSGFEFQMTRNCFALCHH